MSPASIESLQPFAWQIDPAATDSFGQVAVLCMPRAIRDRLVGLRLPEKKIAPVTSLYNAIAAFAPEVVAFAPFEALKASDRDELHWIYLYPDQQLDIKRLENLIKTWLIAWLGDEAGQTEVNRWFPQGSENWSYDSIRLSNSTYSLRRRILPALMTRAVLDDGFQLTLTTGKAERTIPFRLVPLMDMQGKAQLISEPESYRDRRFSFVLKLWLERTPPNDSEVLMGRLGVRRWINTPQVHRDHLSIKGNAAISVYWQRTTGYLSRSAPRQVFTRLALRRMGDQVVWVGQQAALLRILQWGEELPEAEALIRDPAQRAHDLHITFSAQQSRFHVVGAGVWSHDHLRTFQALDTCLQGHHMRAFPVVKRIKLVQRNRKVIQLPAATTSQTERFAALCAMPQPIHIEIYANAARDRLRTIILEETGAIDSHADRLADNPLCVMHDGRLLLEITDGAQRLSDPLDQAATYKHIGSMEKKRRREIANMFNHAVDPTGAIIQLEHYQKKREQSMQLRDPKDAIRMGLLDMRRLSKFFTPDEADAEKSEAGKEYEMRLRNTVRALLAVLGYRPNSLSRLIANISLPANLELIAPWIIQLNARDSTEETLTLLVLFHISIAENQFDVLLPGKTGTPQRFPGLYNAICQIGMQQDAYHIRQLGRVLQFFRDALMDCAHDQNALLILWEENIRRVLPAFSESSGEQWQRALLAESWSGLRAVRLRQSSYGDAPLCIPLERKAKYAGLFQSAFSDRLFYSLHNVGNQHVTKGAQKLDSLNKAAVNPSTMSIWFSQMQPADNLEHWAHFVHALRQESAHTDTPTILPYPLHQVRMIEKYLSQKVDPDEGEPDDAGDALG
jgi:hypothetical protein